MSLKRVIQFIGVVVMIGSLSLIYGFVLSKAWFGIMIALFLAAAGMKAALEPDIIRFGKSPTASNKTTES